MDSTNPELHPERYGGDDVYETKKVAEHWHNVDMYRGWLLITIEKYCSRYGKKDEPLKEAYKIANYAKFLVELEEKLAAEKKEAADINTSTKETREAFRKYLDKRKPKEDSHWIKGSCKALFEGEEK